jgi:hypothetical protein
MNAYITFIMRRCKDKFRKLWKKFRHKETVVVICRRLDLKLTSILLIEKTNPWMKSCMMMLNADGRSKKIREERCKDLMRKRSKHQSLQLVLRTVCMQPRSLRRSSTTWSILLWKNKAKNIERMISISESMMIRS